MHRLVENGGTAMVRPNKQSLNRKWKPTRICSFCGEYKQVAKTIKRQYITSYLCKECCVKLNKEVD